MKQKQFLKGLFLANNVFVLYAYIPTFQTAKCIIQRISIVYNSMSLYNAIEVKNYLDSTLGGEQCGIHRINK